MNLLLNRDYFKLPDACGDWWFHTGKKDEDWLSVYVAYPSGSRAKGFWVRNTGEGRPEWKPSDIPIYGKETKTKKQRNNKDVLGNVRI